ncbi:RNA polymerase sigma factor [bacterium]|nr:RNA polymerase sigma factor [bacterium]
MKPSAENGIVEPKAHFLAANIEMQDQHSRSSASEYEERRWIEKAQKEPQAFERIFEKYHDLIFNYVLRRLCNASLAEDITANTFLKAIHNIRRFEWQGISIAAWLYRIATNEINQNYRKYRRMLPLTTELVDNLMSEQTTDSELIAVDEHLQKNQKFKQASAALSRIKLKYQTVLTLRYFEEKSIQEIAEILGKNENTIKTQIRRGLIYLRRQL